MTEAAPNLPTVEAPKPILQMAQRVFVWFSALVLFGLWGFSIFKGAEQKWISFAFMLLTAGYVFSVTSTQLVTLMTGGKVMEAVAAATGVIASAASVAQAGIDRAASVIGAPAATTQTTTTTTVAAPATDAAEDQ